MRVLHSACGGGSANIEWLGVDEEAAVELALGVAVDLHHLALSCRSVPVGDAWRAHSAALQKYH